MIFQTPYTKQASVPEVGSPEILVERSGYISPQKQIENMILAGHRLRDYRASQFDFPDENSIDLRISDPTRSANFDMADATQIQLSAEERIRQLEAELKASQIAQEPQEGASTVQNEG